MRKPGWFVAFCIMAICLGSMGVMGGLWQVVGALFGNAFNDLVLQMQPQVPNPASDLNRQLMDEQMAVAEQYKWVSVGLGVVNFVLSGLLVAGGVLTLQLKSVGRKILLPVFVLAALYEVVAAVPTFLIQKEISAVQQKFLGQMMQSSSPNGKAPPPQIKNLAETFASIFASVAMVIGLTWAAAKTAAYLSGFFYLRRPSLQPLFATSDASLADGAHNLEDFSDLGDWDEK